MEDRSGDDSIYLKVHITILKKEGREMAFFLLYLPKFMEVLQNKAPGIDFTGDRYYY